MKKFFITVVLSLSCVLSVSAQKTDGGVNA